MMDAVEYLKETFRMCSSFDVCDECPFHRHKIPCDGIISPREADKAVAIVTYWSIHNPENVTFKCFDL